MRVISIVDAESTFIIALTMIAGIVLVILLSVAWALQRSHREKGRKDSPEDNIQPGLISELSPESIQKKTSGIDLTDPVQVSRYIVLPGIIFIGVVIITVAIACVWTYIYSGF